jgi:hypothetical protein
VTVNFWALTLLLDPALIEDTHVFQDYVPGWMDHSLHTSVLLFTLAELLLSYRPYPRWSALGRILATVVVLAYTSWYVLTVCFKIGHASFLPYSFQFITILLFEVKCAVEKRRYINQKAVSTGLHCATSQKTATSILVTVRTSNLAKNQTFQ